MSLRKRISESRERSARERAKRREERRRADRAKAGATAADRAKARAERAKAEEKAKPAAKAKAKREIKVKPRDKPKAQPEPKSKSKAKTKPERGSKPEPKAKTRERPERRPGAEPKAEAGAAKSGRNPVRPFGKRTEPASKRRAQRRPIAGKGGRALAGGAGKVGTGIRSVVAEVLKLGREMIAIPVQLWLAGAEIVGAFVLRAWLRVVRPALIGLWRAGRATLAFAHRHVTPARAVALVTLVAAGALAASQWLDYHSVSVGTDAYSDAVGAVAPPPEIESEVAGNAHAWVMLPLAAAALVVLVLAVTGRRGLAALLIPIGLAVIVIALVVDLPKGLDEGSASIAYEGASASLLEGFWVQLAAAVVLVGCGLMLGRYLRPAARTAAAPTGPTLFQSGAAAARRLVKRRPQRKRAPKPTDRRTGRKAPSARGKRKVQGAGT